MQVALLERYTPRNVMDWMLSGRPFTNLYRANSDFLDGFRALHQERKSAREASNAYRSAHPAYAELEGKYQELLWDALQDPNLMQCIMFSNDVLETPPLETWLRYLQKAGIPLPSESEAHERIGREAYKHLKRSVGCFWGFVFRRPFQYDVAITTSIPENAPGFRNASFFRDNPRYHQKPSFAVTEWEGPSQEDLDRVETGRIATPVSDDPVRKTPENTPES